MTMDVTWRDMRRCLAPASRGEICGSSCAEHPALYHQPCPGHGHGYSAALDGREVLYSHTHVHVRIDTN